MGGGGGGQIPPEPPPIAAARLVEPVHYKWGQLTSNCTGPCNKHKRRIINYLLNISCAVTSVWSEQTYSPQFYSSRFLNIP